MQPKAPIENSLQELQRLYDSAVDASHKTYYSKLALLELCGWLEDNFDDILLTFCSSRISAKANQEYLSKTIIDRTHGCSYADHFRHMLIRVIGLINTEKLESSLDGTGELSAMSARL
jgi:hypothetical protein